MHEVKERPAGNQDCLENDSVQSSLESHSCGVNLVNCPQVFTEIIWGYVWCCWDGRSRRWRLVDVRFQKLCAQKIGQDFHEMMVIYLSYPLINCGVYLFRVPQKDFEYHLWSLNHFFLDTIIVVCSQTDLQNFKYQNWLRCQEICLEVV